MVSEKIPSSKGIENTKNKTGYFLKIIWEKLTTVISWKSNSSKLDEPWLNVDDNTSKTNWLNVDDNTNLNKKKWFDEDGNIIWQDIKDFELDRYDKIEEVEWIKAHLLNLENMNFQERPIYRLQRLKIWEKLNKKPLFLKEPGWWKNKISAAIYRDPFWKFVILKKHNNQYQKALFDDFDELFLVINTMSEYKSNINISLNDLSNYQKMPINNIKYSDNIEETQWIMPKIWKQLEEREDISIEDAPQKIIITFPADEDINKIYKEIFRPLVENKLYKVKWERAKHHFLNAFELKGIYDKSKNIYVQKQESKIKWELIEIPYTRLGTIEKIDWIDTYSLDFDDKIFQERSFDLVKQINIWVKLDKKPVILRENAYIWDKSKISAAIYKIDWKFIILKKQYNQYEKAYFYTRNDLEKALIEIFKHENLIKVNHQDLVYYSKQNLQTETNIKKDSHTFKLRGNWNNISLDEKKESLEKIGITMEYYREELVTIGKGEEIFQFKTRKKDNIEKVNKIIQEYSQEQISNIIENKNIQKLLNEWIKIPIGRIEEIADLDNESIENIIDISPYPFLINKLYYYNFEMLKKFTHQEVQKLIKLNRIWWGFNIHDLFQFSTVSDNVVEKILANDWFRKLHKLQVSDINRSLSIPYDIQLIANISGIIEYLSPKIKQLKKLGFKINLWDIKPLINLENLSEFERISKNIGKNKTKINDAKKSKDKNKFNEIEKDMKKESDIFIELINEVKSELNEKDERISKYLWKWFDNRVWLINYVLKEIVYPKINSIDGEQQKNIIMTISQYVWECYNIQRYLNNEIYKDNPSRLLCDIKWGVSFLHLKWKVEAEREWWSLIFYVENELDFVRIQEWKQEIFEENNIYKDPDGKEYTPAGGFASKFSKIDALSNTLVVINGTKEKTNKNVKIHELRHSLDYRLMSFIEEATPALKSAKMEILAYMLEDLNKETITQILTNGKNYHYGMEIWSKYWTKHIRKVKKYIDIAFIFKESWQNDYLNRLAITPLNSRKKLIKPPFLENKN